MLINLQKGNVMSEKEPIFSVLNGKGTTYVFSGNTATDVDGTYSLYSGDPDNYGVWINANGLYVIHYSPGGYSWYITAFNDYTPGGGGQINYPPYQAGGAGPTPPTGTWQGSINGTWITGTLSLT